MSDPLAAVSKSVACNPLTFHGKEIDERPRTVAATFLLN
jgi:hypothetical protein